MTSDARPASGFDLHAPVPAPASAQPTPTPSRVSDDGERGVDAFLDALRTRALRQHLCEALCAGALVALLFLLALLRVASPTALLAVGIASLITGAAAWLFFRGRARQEAALITLAEAGHPALRNLLVTERELAREPDRATPRIRARVRLDAARVIADAVPSTIIPSSSLTRPLVGAVAIAAVAAGLLLSRDRIVRATASDRDATSAAAPTDAAAGDNTTAPVTGGIGTVTLVVTPPAYAGRPAVTVTNPTSVTALVGSTITLQVDATAPALVREFAGQRLPLTRANAAAARSTRFTGAIVAQETGVLTLTATTGDDAQPAELARRLIAVAVTPDQPPTVKLTGPGKDLLFPDNKDRVTFQAEATDDIGLRALTLHYTKVTGSGERYEFTEGEIPITVARTEARAWRGETTRTLASLEINEGDTFVYYAAATDHRPGQPRAVSDSFVIEIGQGGIAIAGGFAIPPEEDTFAISLSALIQKTEKLHAARATMPRAAFAEASLGLAIEQRMVRSEFLFSMGSHGHVQDEEEEAEHSDEIQAGRLANRGQAELSEATRQMTRAEQRLTDAETGPALTAQRAALAAVQRAMSRQRYFLRTLAVGGTIDPTRRLTGNLTEAKPDQRPDAAPADTTRADRLRGVLQALASLGAAVRPSVSFAWSTPAMRAERAMAEDARAAAGRLLALDPTSAALRGASQQLLDAAVALDARDFARAQPLIQQATDALLPLVRDASSPAGATAGAALTPGDRRLRGATLDALRGRGGAR